MKFPVFIAIIFILLSPITHSQEHKLPENSSLVKAGNKFITLLGNQVEVGDIAPDFKVVNNNFTPVTLEQFKNKNILISVVPSLDTGVCSIQTQKFNKALANMPENTVFLTISNDLPFAQKRFCTTENIAQMKVFSDSVWRDFGTKYGLLIKDMGLLTRAIFILNTNHEIIYKELVANISNHPNYEKALEQITQLSQKK